MSFATRSRKRVDALKTAIEDYVSLAKNDQQFFDPTQISDLSSQTRVRSDPVVSRSLTQLDAEIEQVEQLEVALAQARDRTPAITIQISNHILMSLKCCSQDYIHGEEEPRTLSRLSLFCLMRFSDTYSPWICLKGAN